jgi:Lrp/AsnC family transcriptional regulator for asnA, asnC and gidA
MDKIDHEIIKELQSDGRQSYTKLADIVGVTEGTIRKRVKELHKQGVINIKAVLNPNKIGYKMVCMMAIQVKMADLLNVAKMLAEKPNVYYLAFVTGRYDMLALVLARTPEELSNFITEHISGMPSILRTETFVNLEIIKSPWIANQGLAQLIIDSELT